METIIGAIIGATATLMASGVTYWIFIHNNRKKEQRQLALQLLKTLMTDEYFVKARLISQSYLLPNGAKHSVFNGKRLNFIEIDEFLSKEVGEDNEARFYIRAVPNFFWLVELARQDGLILKYEKLFSKIYAFYWNFIIEPHIKGCEDTEQFRKFDNLLTEEDDAKAKNNYKELLQSLFKPPTNPQI